MASKCVYVLIISLMSGGSAQNFENLEGDAAKLMSDYFQWKKVTWPRHYHHLGFNEVAGEMGVLSISAFEAMWSKCQNLRVSA